MARRPLPRILSNGSAQLARSRELARTAADSATDVLHPLITVSRGLRRLAAAGRSRWAETPKDRRGPLLFLAASVILVVALVPYGPLLAVVTLMAAAAWQGRDRAPAAPEGPDESQIQRLQALYEALVPYFATAEDPSPLYVHGGEWEKAFPSYEFDASGRIHQLEVRYPAYFPDGEPRARARVEHLLSSKAGRGREYHFAWDEEGNAVTVTVLVPLPTDIAAQRFVTAPGETVLGFTDPSQVQRTLPLTHGEEPRDVPPVVWRTGARSTEPHLLAVGHPGSGTSTLLRSIALQTLPHGDILVVDGGGTGEYACLTGRDGVLGVEVGLSGAVAALEWAAHETERRLIAMNHARQAGDPAPADTRRPLWILLDRPTAFSHLAATDGRPDPQALLQVPLRHGRAAQVTVVVAEQFDSLDALTDPVRQHTRARVVLGAAPLDLLESVLGSRPHTTPVDHVPPGRGYARLGTGPVHRLQVPATPDPYDDATSEAHRQAVLELLPPRSTPADGEHLPVPAEAAAAEARSGGGTAVTLTKAVPQAQSAPADALPPAEVPSDAVPADAAPRTG
ncbi:ABC transporter ATP-binding protein [Streptomyces sp. NPDC091281]|uniref:ATP-binding cassette domain-containing protein n=1 Tax=Streptomyces sp. NPDC091281 TaxID=3365985 RepID=UPI0037F8818C